jgi:hypothetical protein
MDKICQCGKEAQHRVRLLVGGEYVIYHLCPACYQFEKDQQAYDRRPSLIPADRDFHCVICGAIIQPVRDVQRITCGKRCTLSLNNRQTPVTPALPGRPRMSSIPLEVLAHAR